MTAPTRPATTILLLSDAPGADTGMRVFMVQRHRRSGFLPNAWVFPGGRVDDADALAGNPRIRGGDRAIAAMGVPREQAIAFLVAGVRETFEEAGVWLGSGSLSQDARDALNDRQTTMREVLEHHDATVDLDLLVPWAWWVTPKAEPKRYDTWFLAARIAEEHGVHDDKEVVNSGWFDPIEVADATLTDFPVAPPTWWTLQELAKLATPERALADSRDLRPVEPILEFGEAGMRLVLPGHPEHAEGTIGGLPAELGFDGQRWIPR